MVALRPKAVAILGGINDLRHSDTDATLEDLENNLASMMEIANANGIRVILASVLPIADKDAEKQAPISESPNHPRPNKVEMFLDSKGPQDGVGDRYSE